MTEALSSTALTSARPQSRTEIIPAVDPRTAALTGYLTNNLETIPGNFRRYALSAACAPTGEQRGLLLARRQQLDAGLIGCDDKTIRECVGMLRSVLASQQLGPQAMELARAAFLKVLGRYPSWAVTEACERFLDGRAGGSNFAPTPAEIAALCRTLTADALSERAQINAILDAEVYALPSDDDRKKVADLHAEFVAETMARAARLSADLTRPIATVPTAERMAAVAQLEELRRKREAAEAHPVQSDAESAA